jgi:hypothetical protein
MAKGRRELADGPDDGIALLPSDDTGFLIRFLPTDEEKSGQNAIRRSPGAVRHRCRRPGRTGCTSTSLHQPTAISKRRSTGR